MPATNPNLSVLRVVPVSQPSCRQKISVLLGRRQRAEKKKKTSSFACTAFVLFLREPAPQLRTVTALPSPRQLAMLCPATTTESVEPRSDASQRAASRGACDGGGSSIPTKALYLVALCQPLPFCFSAAAF